MQTVAFASVNWKLCLFAAVVALVSYLLGSVSFAVIVSRMAPKTMCATMAAETRA